MLMNNNECSNELCRGTHERCWGQYKSFFETRHIPLRSTKVKILDSGDTLTMRWHDFVFFNRRNCNKTRELSDNKSRRGGWGGGVLNKFLYGEAPPWGPTPYSFICHFSQKRYPFRFPSIDKWYPFHIPCLELCIPFNCCKCTVF